MNAHANLHEEDAIYLQWWMVLVWIHYLSFFWIDIVSSIQYQSNLYL